MTITPEKTCTIFLQRHSHRGKTQIVPCTVSILKPEHTEQSVALHDRVAQGLSGDIFIRSDINEIRRCISDDGFTLGVWHEDKLVCARTVKTDAQWVNEALEAIGEPSDPTHATAVTDYMVVDREFRGNSIQFLTFFLSETLISINKDRIVSTVAPKNIFSLQNIMRCGFYTIGLKQLYGGFWRYVTEKKLRGSLPIWTNWHHTVSIRNTDEQRRLIAEGNVGYKLVKRIGGFAMLYAPICVEMPIEGQPHRCKPVIRML